MTNDVDGTIPRRGLLGYWDGRTAPDGRLHDWSNEGNDGIYGRTAKWVWFTNPRAVRFVGDYDRTYLGYLGGPSGTDVVVGMYDHDTGAIEETVVADDVSPDDHVGPAVRPLNDGHLLVLWSKHDGPTLSYRLSERPEDPSVFDDRQTLDGTAVCYPNPIQLGDDPGAPLHLFYRDRDGTGDGHIYYRKSMDRGHTYSPPQRVVTAPQGHYSVYWVAASRNGDIHLFFTDAEGPSTGPKWNIAYACFTDGTFYEADGTVIGTESTLPIRVQDLETVYDAAKPSNHDAWIWDCGVDADGNPAVVYATFPSSLAHEYRYARWTGTAWDDSVLVGARRYVGADPVTPYFSGGIAMPTHDPDVVYASVTRGKYAVIERLETDDGGRTFATETVSDRAVADNFRPVVPENHHPDAPVVWIGGAYNDLDGSQTVLRGLPSDTPGTELTGSGQQGVSLGIDLYDDTVFVDGFTVVAAAVPTSNRATGTLVDYGGAIELSVPADEPGKVVFQLDSATDSVQLTVDGLSTDRHVLVGIWDGEQVELAVDGHIEADAVFEDPVSFADGCGWTLLKPQYFVGDGFDGRLDTVAIYDRALTKDQWRRFESSDCP